MFPRNHYTLFKWYKIERFWLVFLSIVLLLGGCIQPIRQEAQFSTSAPQFDLEVVGHVGGAVLSIAVQDNYAYLGFSHEFMVLDVHNPEQPRWLTSLPLPTNHLIIADHYAYVVGRAGFAIIDLADPANPHWMSSITAPYTATDVAIDGLVAYFTALNKLYTVDISEPKQPTLISEIRLAPRLVGVWADQGFVYVSSDKGLHVVDCTDPARPTVAAQLDLNANDESPVLVNGYLYAVANRQLAITCLSPMITLACASLISQNRRNRAKLCFSKHWIAPPK